MNNEWVQYEEEIRALKKKITNLEREVTNLNSLVRKLESQRNFLSYQLDRYGAADLDKED
jgi:predicted RNase H-like nuclease (RuvC/YqgF family)